MAQSRSGDLPNYLMAPEEIFLVSDFLHTWGITYTKNPNEPFLAGEDEALLFGDSAHRQCVVFKGPLWSAEVMGAMRALKYIRLLVNKRGFSYEAALDEAQKDYEQAEKEVRKRERQADKRLANVEIDVTCSWDLIDLHLRRTILYYLRGSRPTKRLLPKNYSNTYDLDTHQWRFMLKSWDYRHKDGTSYAQIADELAEQVDGLDTRTVQRWVEEIDKRIKAMKNTKRNLPKLLFFDPES